MKNKEIVKAKFEKQFGTTGAFYFSPGRINLIGEHTDYNGGFVLPGAIDKGMLLEIRENGTDLIRAYAVDLVNMPSSVWKKKTRLLKVGPVIYSV